MKLLRLPAVIDRVGIKRTSIYKRIKEGKFPAPIKLSENVSVWPSCEVDACTEAIIKGYSDNEIKALVQQLHTQRQA